MTTPAAAAMLDGPGSAAAAARAPTAKRPSLRLRRETCNAVPPWQSAPATPLPLVRPRARATSASRLSLRAPQRKLAAEAGGAHGLGARRLRWKREHLLQSAARRVHVDAVVTAEPGAIAVGLGIGENLSVRDQLAVALTVHMRLEYEPDLSAVRRVIRAVGDVDDGPAGGRKAQEVFAASRRVVPGDPRPGGQVH